MMLSALSAANAIGEMSSWTLSDSELQMLVYVAHMFHLGNLDQPLVKHSFEAWDCGPVHPVLQQRLRTRPYYGGRVFYDVPAVATASPCYASLREAFATMGKAGLKRLANATRRPDGAWSRAYRPGASFGVISNDDIRREYLALAAA